MKIAITADCHLKSDESSPERYETLKNILDRVLERDIITLIIAGDLFDKDANNYTKFEKLAGQKKYSEINIITIRGNHDINILPGQFTLPNFTVIDKPTWKMKDKFGIDFLFIPYIRNKKMAQVIEENIIPRQSEDWVLVCHGNLIHGHRDVDPYEKGIYMPLLSADIQRYKPARVFIGHIHKLYDSTEIIIPGSPCGLDITESGKRSFIVFDTTTLEYEREIVKNTTIFLDAQISIIPAENEMDFIQNEIEGIFSRRGISKADRKLVTLRLIVNGYTSNMKKAKKVIEDQLKDIRKYKDGSINFDNLKISNDIERDFIIKKFKEEIINQISKNNVDSALEEEIMKNALDLVYGEQ